MNILLWHKMFSEIFLRSIFLGGFLGFCYAFAFMHEKKKSLRRYLNSAKYHEKIEISNQVRLLSLISIARYIILIGVFAFFIYFEIVTPITSATSFLVFFWGGMFWLLKKNYENKTF